MKPKIAVFGAGDSGHTITADLTFAGYEVNLLELRKYRDRIAGIRRLGGIQLKGKEHALISGKNGFAEPNVVTTDPKMALHDVDVIFVDIPMTDFEGRIKAIARYLKDEQIVNFTFSSWACLRAAKILNKMGKTGIIFSESPAPVYRAAGKDGYANSTLIRRGVPLSVFPSNRTKEAFDTLKHIFPTFEMARNVLQTNFESIGMLVHPSIAMLNMGSLDRAAIRNELFDFYVTGNTAHAGILAEAYDRERIPVCNAYNVQYTSLREHIIRYYESKGQTIQEAIGNCKLYQYHRWVIKPDYIFDLLRSRDIPLAMVPLIELGELADIVMPIASAFVKIFGAAFNLDFRRKGLTLDKLGLADLNVEGVIDYVSEGKRK